MEKNFFNEHQIKIFSYTTTYFWLLLIPIVRGLFSLRGDLISWFFGVWVDLLALGFIFLFAFIQWKNVKISIENNKITCKSGIFIKKYYSIPFEKVTSYYLVSNYFLKKINVQDVLIDTNHGSRSKFDLSLKLSVKHSDKLLETLKENNVSKFENSYSQNRFFLFAFSAIFSDTLSGVLIIATTIYQIGRYIENELFDNLLEKRYELQEIIQENVTAVATFIALVFVGSWLLSFVLNLLKNKEFNVSRFQKELIISSGFVTKKVKTINISKINFISYKQNILSKIFKFSSVKVDCTGFGKAKRETPLLIPISTNEKSTLATKKLLPEFDLPKIKINVPKRHIKRFLWFPLFFIILIPILIYVAVRIFPIISPLALFLLIAAEIPFLWFLIVRIIAALLTGIGIEKDYLVLSYSDYYAFNKVVIHKDKIAKIKVTKTPLQRYSGLCTLNFYTKSEKGSVHKVKHLREKEVFSLLSDNFDSVFH